MENRGAGRIGLAEFRPPCQHGSMASAYWFPAPLPADFPCRVALRCARLVGLAYALYQQWSDAGKPPAARMRFRPVALGRIVLADPFWRTLTYRKPRPRGPKATGPRFQTMVEHTPAGACAESGKILYMVFRGTIGNAEKITNFMAGKEDAVFDDLPGGGVHRGFLRCYATVRESILDFLEARAGRDKTIRIAGYSLGGALASLAAMDVATSWLPYRKLEVFTFASPRTGSVKWAEHYDRQRQSSWRIANKQDPVAKVPFKFLGYRHVGVPLRFAALSGLAAHSLDNAYLPVLRAAAHPHRPTPQAKAASRSRNSVSVAAATR